MNKHARFMLWLLPIAFLVPTVAMAEEIPTITWEQAKDYMDKAKLAERAAWIRWEQAQDRMEKEVYVTGKVVRTNKIASGSVFLNFAQNYRGTLSIFIPAKTAAQFSEPPEKAYKDKEVKIKGKVTEYKGSPSLTLSGPDAIALADSSSAGASNGTSAVGTGGSGSSADATADGEAATTQPESEAPRALDLPPSEPGVPVIPWSDARYYIGKDVYVVGKVVRANKIQSGLVFLNFAENYKGTLTVLIKPPVSKRMTVPPEEAYKNKVVRVRGSITEYKGDPSLTLQDPDKIVLLPDGTPMPTANGAAGAASSNGQAVTHPVSGPIQPEEYLPTIPWTMAQDFIGQEALIVGKIVRTSRIPNGPTFLNFDKDHQNTMSVYIRANNADNFPISPDKMYKDKMVQVRSVITSFKNKPSISVSSDEYIKILPDDTPLPKEAVVPPQLAPTMKAVPGETIRLASYNVYNLFDDWNDPYHVDEPSDMKPREQLKTLAKGIREVNADVLVLIEVENIGILRLFLRVFLPDMGYEPILIEGNDGRGIDVAVLSRFPVGPVTTYKHVRFPEGENGKMTTFRRDLLRVPVMPPGVEPFEVFAVHYKSKGGQADGGIETRLAEAKHTRQVVDEILKNDPKARFFIAGDFNDTIDSEPMKALLGSGATALKTWALEMPAEKQVTYNQEPYRSMIDFFLFSPELAKHYVPKSYDTVPGSPMTTGSDHNAVVCEFRAK